jgi:hypothetical protein
MSISTGHLVTIFLRMLEELRELLQRVVWCKEESRGRISGVEDTQGSITGSCPVRRRGASAQ